MEQIEKFKVRENAQPPKTNPYPRLGNKMEHDGQPQAQLLLSKYAGTPQAVGRFCACLLRLGFLHSCVSQLSTFGAGGLTASLMGVFLLSPQRPGLSGSVKSAPNGAPKHRESPF